MRNIDDPKRVVAQGYDQIGGRYGEQAVEADTEQRARYTSEVLNRLPAGADVLDLGCGSGVPTTRRLAERFNVTGVDISERQVERARRNVPSAAFLCADMAEVEFPPESFDGVSAFYSIIHVPRDEQAALLKKIAAWLRPGGLLVATLGARPGESDSDDTHTLGVPMYWSSHDSRTNRRFVEEAGLRIVNAIVETTQDDGEEETFLWVIAQKPQSS
ncbi:MAG: methyltransferase domain-containing protein [Chloroflexi bacterium]|nr:methyltransferase domain-containing protein [Chloroflexota bacterium]